MLHCSFHSVDCVLKACLHCHRECHLNLLGDCEKRRMMAELGRPQLLASGNILVPRDIGKEEKGSFRGVILPRCASLGHLWRVLCSQRWVLGPVCTGDAVLLEMSIHRRGPLRLLPSS